MCFTSRLLHGLLFLSLSLTMAGCGLVDGVRSFLQGDENRTIAVRVGGKEYSQADLKRFFDFRLSDFRDPADVDKVKSSLLDSFIEEKLLLHKAERLNVKLNPQVLKSMLEKINATGDGRQDVTGSTARDAELERSLGESLKMQQYLHDYLLKNVSVTEEECLQYYKQHQEDYIRDDDVHVREILVEKKELAERILVLLKANRNKNFGELARVYSKAPSSADGGDLGTFQRGDLPEEFEKVIFPLAPGTRSDIVQTKYGYHIFLVEEKILAHRQKFYEVKEQIQEKLLLERERQIINKELQSLMEQVPVEIYWNRLDFRYIGSMLSTEGGNSPNE